MNDIELLKQDMRIAESKARSLKTKKAQEKAWTRVRELEHSIFIKLCNERDLYGEFSFKGTVKSFSGGDEFLIETPYGHIWLSPTSDVLSKSWYSHTCCVEYTEGQTVYITAIIDVNNDRLTLEIIPKKIIGGILNSTQYTELCKKDNLAFFKYPTGMSGLFSSKEVSS